MGVKLGQLVSFTATPTDMQLVGTNTRRTSLTVCSSISTDLTYQFGQPAVRLLGLVMPPNSPPFTLTRAELGDLLYMDVHVVAGAVNGKSGILEVSDP